jgi:hypothetical protein
MAEEFLPVDQYRKHRDESIRKEYRILIVYHKKDIVFNKLSKKYQIPVGNLPRIVFSKPKTN